MNGPRFRPTWVEVDLDRLRHNVRALTPPGAELMAVVKADAYGHGDAPVARAAIDAGATWLGVALVEEGLRLRLAGIEAPILVLSEAPEGSEAVLLAHRLTPTIYSRPGLRRLAAAARGPVAVHVKIDTGMGRMGIRFDQLNEFVDRQVLESVLARRIDELRSNPLHFCSDHFVNVRLEPCRL